MPSTEVQRTLVKSPPELWTELSDPASLARHLGELGEIRVTRVEPESSVEWEAENLRGVVRLKASGWGTRVTFSVTREPPQQEAQEPAPEATETPQTKPEPTEPEATAPEATAPEATETPQTEPEATAPVLQEAVPQPPRHPRRGFFARLFRRRRTAEAVVASATDLAPMAGPEAEPVPTSSESQPTGASPGPEREPEREPAAGEPAAETAPMSDPAPATAELAAELEAMEQRMVEQDTALLSAVLDRLGAAHHRPFSRG